MFIIIYYYLSLLLASGQAGVRSAGTDGKMLALNVH
jgi:hypothetical protein